MTFLGNAFFILSTELPCNAFDHRQPASELGLSEGQFGLDLTNGQPLMASLDLYCILINNCTDCDNDILFAGKDHKSRKKNKLLIKLLGEEDYLNYFTAQKIMWLWVHPLLALLMTRKCVDMWLIPHFIRHISTQIVLLSTRACTE